MPRLELSIIDVLSNMGIALVLALVVSYLYRYTHAGYSYSRAFNISLIGIAMIVTMVMMVIADQLALSLGLVGAISVVRFRTAVKDPRDLSYIFLSVTVGLACSTGNHMVAIGGTFAVCFVLLVLHYIQFGRVSSADYTLTFCLESPDAVKDFQQAAATLFEHIVMRSSAQIDSSTFEYVYSVFPTRDVPEDVVPVLRERVSGISRISLVQPETFVDV